MKIGIIGDTHDNVINVKRAIQLFKRKKVNFVIHTGDIQDTDNDCATGNIILLANLLP